MVDPTLTVSSGKRPVSDRPYLPTCPRTGGGRCPFKRGTVTLHAVPAIFPLGTCFLTYSILSRSRPFFPYFRLQVTKNKREPRDTRSFYVVLGANKTPGKEGDTFKCIKNYSLKFIVSSNISFLMFRGKQGRRMEGSGFKI